MKKWISTRVCSLWLGLGCLAAWPVNALVCGAEAGVKLAVCLGLFVALAAYALHFSFRGKALRDAAIPLMLAGSFVMGLVVALCVPYNFSAHDLGPTPNVDTQTLTGGHLGYITYLVKFGRLPIESPLAAGSSSIFYHPPAYHILQSLFLRLNLQLGLPFEVCLENLQIVTLFFSLQCVALTLRVVRLLGLPDRAAALGLLFVAFQPLLFLLGSTLNNDIASIYFVFLAIFYAVKWYQRPSMGSILGVALALGLGMATKLSTAIVAVPIGLLFLIRFWQSLYFPGMQPTLPEQAKQGWKAFCPQFLVFLLVSVPLGTAWPVYHALRFQMPFSYVPTPGPEFFVGDLSAALRFGLPVPELLASPFQLADRGLRFNVWLQTLKTGAFDEFRTFAGDPAMSCLGYVLLALFTLTLLLCLALFLRALFKKSDLLPPALKLFFGLYAALLAGSYLLFCVQYPYISTFNFRYILPIVLPCALGLAFAFAGQTPSRPARFTALATGIFAVLSCFFYAAFPLAYMV